MQRLGSTLQDSARIVQSDEAYVGRSRCFVKAAWVAVNMARQLVYCVLRVRNGNTWEYHGTLIQWAQPKSIYHHGHVQTNGASAYL